MLHRGILAGLLIAQATVAWAASLNLLEQLPDYWLLTVVSGVSGGVCSFFYSHQQRGMRLWPQGVMTIFSGGLVAAFASPLTLVVIGDWLPTEDLVGASRAMFLGFCVGVLGIDIVGLIMRFSAMRTRQLERDDGP